MWLLYKTIVLELIHERTELYERLRSSKRLLPTMDAYAIELKARHEHWKDRIGRANPGGDPSRTAAETLELASPLPMTACASWWNGSGRAG